MMFRSIFIPGLTAMAIATAPVATPAAARDTGDVLLGLGALALIGGLAIQANEQSRHRSHSTQRRVTHGHRTHGHRHGYHAGNHRIKTPHVPHYNHRPRHAQKPAHCLRQRWTNYGWKTFYSRKCLARHGYHY